MQPELEPAAIDPFMALVGLEAFLEGFLAATEALRGAEHQEAARLECIAQPRDRLGL